MADRLPPIDEQDVKLCNCSACSQEILGESMAHLVDCHGKQVLPRRFHRHGYVYLRARGRPLCQPCGMLWEVQEGSHDA